MFGDKRDKSQRFFHYNFFTKNRKGLSTVVVTLIIILISLVAVGIVWVVVRGILSGGTEGIEINNKCLSTVVEATSANCTSVGGNQVCDVQLMRSGTEASEIEGVKLVFRDSVAGESSNLISVDGNIEVLVGKKQTGIDTTLASVDRLDVTVFFKDSAGKERFCSQTNTFTNFS